MDSAVGIRKNRKLTHRTGKVITVFQTEKQAILTNCPFSGYASKFIDQNSIGMTML